MRLPAGAIFGAFLQRITDDTLVAERRMLHRVFREAQRKHPDEMSSFEFRMRSDGWYSPVLDQLFGEFQQSARLRAIEPWADASGPMEYEIRRGVKPLLCTDQNSLDRVAETLITVFMEEKKAAAVPADKEG